MKRVFISLALSTVALTAIPSAAVAAPWQSINQRQERLYNRIEQGVRSGELTRREAQNLRFRFTELNRLEYRYRRTGGGLNRAERIDLDKRFNNLSYAIRRQKNDRQDRG